MILNRLQDPGALSARLVVRAMLAQAGAHGPNPQPNPQPGVPGRVRMRTREGIEAMRTREGIEDLRCGRESEKRRPGLERPGPRAGVPAVSGFDRCSGPAKDSAVED